jgi:hypothetical protein
VSSKIYHKQVGKICQHQLFEAFLMDVGGTLRYQVVVYQMVDVSCYMMKIFVPQKYALKKPLKELGS